MANRTKILKMTENEQNCENYQIWSKLPEITKIFIMTKNGQNEQNDQNEQKFKIYQKWSKLPKMTKKCQNSPKF